MKTILPFTIGYLPITKLSLINFEKDPDEIYSGLELQYIDGAPYGKGYRILAYRNDKYVDVYDDMTLNPVEGERFDVAQKGLKKHVRVSIENQSFCKKNGNVTMSFSFVDIEGRNIDIMIKENSKKKSKPMNLLAPIGAGTEKPTFLPLFFLYNFDFVRKANTKVSIKIGEKERKLDNFPFPVPLGGQWRYYTRYTLDSQIIEFINAKEGQLDTVETDSNNCYINGAVKYQFEKTLNELALSSITIEAKDHPVKMEFCPPLSYETGSGTFQIRPDKVMGSIEGCYEVKKEGKTVHIQISPEGGWTSAPDTFITKKILGKNSIFCTWSKKYVYEQEIDLETLAAKSRWHKNQ